MKLKLTSAQTRRASTSLALAWSEYECAQLLKGKSKYREAVGRLYFACFHAGQAVLGDRITTSLSHKNLKAELNKSSKSRSIPPPRYARLHNLLHELRIRAEYKSSASPEPGESDSRIKAVERYLRYVTRIVPRLELQDVISELVVNHRDVIQELSFDIYHPHPYYDGQTRLTVWQPAHEVKSFTPDGLIRKARRFLADIKADSPDGYVAGLNSRLNQYGEPVHLLMLDLDTTDPAVETALRTVGGTLLKSGRGFHFIGTHPIRGHKRWEGSLRSLRKRKDLKGYVDLSHIEYSLKRGYSTLRLTSGPEKPQVPFFYKELR
jgi:uncharacterized protein (UPF0332 family)